MRKYLWNILIGIDQLGNTLLGGDPDETISSRIAKNMHLWYARYVGAGLEAIDPGHLKDALEDDEGTNAAWKFPGEK